MRTLLLVVALLSIAVGTASGTILVGFPTVSSCGAGCWTWSYAVNLTSPGYEVIPGDFFTIYDFGPVLGFTEPTGWTFSTSATGPDPTGFTPASDTSVSNITWTFNGSIADITTPSFLGTFTANSLFSGKKLGQFAAADTQIIPGDGTADAFNSGNTQVPVPEPTTLVLFGGGLIGVALYRRRKA